MRRTATIAITREGRDLGKTFILTEMAAVAATEWFDQAMQFLARSGADVPADIFEHGAAGFAVIGIGAALASLGRVPYAEARPLLDALLGCVTSVTAPGAIAPVTVPSQIRGQIEEVATIYQLREEVLSLHLGFSLAARLSSYREVVAAMIGDGPNIETSTAPLES